MNLRKRTLLQGLWTTGSSRSLSQRGTAPFFSVAVQQLTQHELEDSPMAVVQPLVRGIDAHARLEFLVARLDLERLGAVLEGVEVERLLARQTQRLGVLAVRELQRQDPHADQVGAMDALVALGDHELDALQVRPLGRPVT